jgi:hypothetical protein
VRTDGVEPDVLLWQIFAVRPNEAYRTTEQWLALRLHIALQISRMVSLLLCSCVHWECCESVSNLHCPRK